MKGFIKDFKSFAMKGNVLQMAIGIMIGAAFGKIVSSLVADIITPLIGLLLGGLDFSGAFLQLGGTEKYLTLEAAKEAGVSTLNYGNFIQSVIDFLIISFVIFIVLRMITKLFAKKEDETVEAPKRVCSYCKMEVAEDATRCPHCTSVLEN